jgi:hypothetical protein
MAMFGFHGDVYPVDVPVMDMNFTEVYGCRKITVKGGWRLIAGVATF